MGRRVLVAGNSYTGGFSRGGLAAARNAMEDSAGGEFTGDHCDPIVTAEPAGRVITAALVVVPGPGDTVTFVWQERGPYAGWWLLPGGKVEFGEPVTKAVTTGRSE
jgi:hypothetical protein